MQVFGKGVALIPAILRMAAFLIFFARGLLALFIGTSLGTLAGFESFLAPLLPADLSWEAYSSQYYASVATAIDLVQAVIWLLAAALVWAPARWRGLLWPGIFLLLVDVLAGIPGEYYGWAMLPGRALMVLTPVLWWRYPDPGWSALARWGTAGVFLGHGLFALDVFPRPGVYLDMLDSWLGGIASDAFLHDLLVVAGILDMLAALALLLWRRPPRYTWVWLIGWGLLTALARLGGVWEMAWTWEARVVATTDMLIRLPHGLVPLAVWLSRGDSPETRDTT